MGWINVNDQSPPFGRCLIYVKEHDPNIYTDGYGECSYEHIGFAHELLFETKVTHWMPLPSPPKE